MTLRGITSDGAHSIPFSSLTARGPDQKKVVTARLEVDNYRPSSDAVSRGSGGETAVALAANGESKSLPGLFRTSQAQAADSSQARSTGVVSIDEIVRREELKREFLASWKARPGKAESMQAFLERFHREQEE